MQKDAKRASVTSCAPRAVNCCQMCGGRRTDIPGPEKTPAHALRQLGWGQRSPGKEDRAQSGEIAGSGAASRSSGVFSN